MVQFGWIKMSFFVILVLLFTAVTGQQKTSSIAGVGDEVTLPCENVIKNQDKCGGTSWLFSRDCRRSAEELVKVGQIHKSDRLSITAKCSLVIKNVTDKDYGYYTCRQFNKSGKQQGPESQVHLSVVNISELQNSDVVLLYCTVLTCERCGHTVKWLYDGNENDVQTSPSSCSASVSFTTAHLNQKSDYYELLKCAATDDESGRVLLFSLQSSKEKTGFPDWWWFIIVAVGLAALLIIVVAVIGWKKTKGNKTQMDENIGQSLNAAVTQPGPETSQDEDTADPKDGVSYASISYTKKTDSKAQVRGKDDGDEGDAVTYSTVRAPSSSAGASDDLSNLYATINKPNK